MELQTMKTQPDDLESLLASLTAAEAAESDPVVDAILEAKEAEDLADLAAEAQIEPMTEELSDDLLADLEATVARSEVYAAQDAGADSTPAPTTKGAKAPKAPKAPKVAGTPRAPRKELADLDESVFELSNGAVTLDKASVIALRPSQVKIAEKFDNLFLALAAGKEPSNYVVTAIKVLGKNGTMTSADLAAAFKASGLKDGTASSQTGQIMELFKVVGIANRAGQALTLRADSAVYDKLSAIIGAAKAAA